MGYQVRDIVIGYQVRDIMFLSHWNSISNTGCTSTSSSYAADEMMAPAGVKSGIYVFKSSELNFKHWMHKHADKMLEGKRKSPAEGLWLLIVTGMHVHAHCDNFGLGTKKGWGISANTSLGEQTGETCFKNGGEESK